MEIELSDEDLRDMKLMFEIAVIHTQPGQILETANRASEILGKFDGNTDD